MGTLGDNIALLALLATVAGIFAAVVGAIGQSLVTHFVAKRSERMVQDDHEQDRQREISDLIREGLDNDARWRELIYSQRERTEARHSENLQAIEREAKAVDALVARVDHLATEVHLLAQEFQQFRHRRS